MNEIPGINLLPEKWRGYAVAAFLLSPYVTRAAQALMNGGGLKGMLAGIWLGTNTPKPQPKP